jgi:hypothetical protein
MSHKVLHLFRVVGGKRVKIRFVVDEQMTILEETETQEPAKNPDSRIKADLDARGIKYETQDGKLVITHVPELERKSIEALTNIDKCWFEGCREIVEAYIQEGKTLPSDCPACQKGALIRKYRQLLIDAAER